MENNEGFSSSMACGVRAAHLCGREQWLLGKVPLKLSAPEDIKGAVNSLPSNTPIETAWEDECISMNCSLASQSICYTRA